MLKRSLLLFLSYLMVANWPVSEVSAQDFDADEYNKLLWMTTRFYGGQRSGEHNWLIDDHLPDGVPEGLRGVSFLQDGDGDYSLDRGWFDCGDHVKFGQTQYYSGYMLLKSYAEFPEGFNDYYSYDYAGYRNSGEWTYEGNGHDPNNVPDILDEVKHATDYFIQCARSPNQFYFETGNGEWDHMRWVTSVQMQTLEQNLGGEPRPVYDNPNGAAMASFCGATLALMSRMYRPFDEAYADLCLERAHNAYEYASQHPGAVGAASGGFYGPNDNWRNGYAILLAEMYWATEDESFRDEAYNLSVGAGNDGDVHPNAGYTYDYSNNGELALYVLAQLDHPNAEAAFNTRIENHFMNNTNYNAEGIYSAGGDWGKLRYVGNAAFLISLYDKLNDNDLDDRVFSNVDYVMGSNSANLSFVVGYIPPIGGASAAQKPHHRNVYLRDDNPPGNDNSLTIPEKNQQFGALVGGDLNPSNYNDVRNDYVNTEVCIDYNAGLLGALGAIKAQLDPIDPEQFFAQCAAPSDLGGDQTLCGVGEIMLDTELGTEDNRTFEWFRNDESQGAPSSDATSFSVDEPGTWRVVVDSAGECQRSATVDISGELDEVFLGEELTLCDPAMVTLDAGISGEGLSYEWTKDGVNYSAASSIEVTEPGEYELTVSADGCPSVSDAILITSELPEVNGDTLCEAGIASLEALSEGTFEWYDVETGGDPLETGSMFAPEVSATTTFYLQDASSFTGNVGPDEPYSGGQNWGVSENNQLHFTAEQNFTINSLKVYYGDIYGSQGSATITVEVLDANGNSFTPERTFTSDPRQVDPDMSSSLITFTFSDFNVEESWGPELRMRVVDETNIGALLWTNSGASYPYESDPSGVVTITGSSGGSGGSEEYMYFYDWEISSGNSCARKPVHVVIDPDYEFCDEPCEDPEAVILTSGDELSYCQGEDGVTLVAQEVEDASYEWEGSVTGTESTLENATEGDYTLTVNVNGCSSTSETVTVIESPNPEVAEISGDEIVCPGDASASDVHYYVPADNESTYDWQLDGEGEFNYQDMWDVGIDFSNASNGAILSVSQTNEFGCTTVHEELEIIISCVTNLEDSSPLSSVKVFPNPFTHTFTVNNESGNESLTVEIKNMKGVTQLHTEIQGNAEVLGENLPSGVYIMTITSDQKVARHKITKL